MDLDEIVREVIERDSGGMVLQLARETVAQARVAPQILIPHKIRSKIPINDSR